MSRRKTQWKKAIRQASGDVNKIMPTGAKGEGRWLTKTDVEGRSATPPGTGEGKTCTLPIGDRKEKLVRSWAK